MKTYLNTNMNKYKHFVENQPLTSCQWLFVFVCLQESTNCVPVRLVSLLVHIMMGVGVRLHV